MLGITAGMDQKNITCYCAENCGLPQSQFLNKVVDIPYRSAEADPHGPGCSADHRDSSDAVRSQVVDAPVVQVVWFHRLFISVYSALLGSTADTSFESVYGVFHIST